MAQSIALPTKAYQIQANKAVAPPPESPLLEETKLIDYDFAKYGSSAERTRLLKKWDDEVSKLPK